MHATPSPAILRLIPATPCDAPARSGASDLVVSIWPGTARFSGSGALLQAEGLVPKDIEWPAGRDRRSWEAGGFEFTLKCARPAGLRGPMKLWTSGDYWSVDIEVKGRNWEWHAQRNVELQAEAVLAGIQGQSPTGQRGLAAKRDRYLQARQDRAFQAFKASVLG